MSWSNLRPNTASNEKTFVSCLFGLLDIIIMNLLNVSDISALKITFPVHGYFDHKRRRVWDCYMTSMFDICRFTQFQQSLLLFKQTESFYVIFNVIYYRNLLIQIWHLTIALSISVCVCVSNVFAVYVTRLLSIWKEVAVIDWNISKHKPASVSFFVLIHYDIGQ